MLAESLCTVCTSQLQGAPLTWRLRVMQCCGTELAESFLLFYKSCQQIPKARPSCLAFFVLLLSQTLSSRSQGYLKGDFSRNLTYQSPRPPQQNIP